MVQAPADRHLAPHPFKRGDVAELRRLEKLEDDAAAVGRVAALEDRRLAAPSERRLDAIVADLLAGLRHPPALHARLRADAHADDGQIVESAAAIRVLD